MEGVPNTVDGLILGYVAIGFIAVVYVVSLVIRQANLNREAEVLREVIDEDEE